MTGATSSLIDTVNRRAEGDASLAAAALAMLLVPLPALLAAGSSGGAISHLGLAATVGVLGALLAATPIFALPPFVMGCAVGTLMHFALTATERFEALREHREVHLRGRALVAHSLIVGGIFAATGLVAAIAIFRLG
ncbi:MAG: hypothetical protein P4L93_06195 [Coriobacteriia bacterium]|nr:hypothetical protein [Coriobacteriia bacterium]